MEVLNDIRTQISPWLFFWAMLMQFLLFSLYISNLQLKRILQIIFPISGHVVKSKYMYFRFYYRTRFPSRHDDSGSFGTFCFIFYERGNENSRPSVVTTD